MTYPYANVTVRLPDVILNISPLSIVLELSNAVWYKRLPDDEASQIPICVTVPHDAVAVGNVTSASVATEPDVPDAVAKEADVLA
jgi:hypothetical protein